MFDPKLLTPNAKVKNIHNTDYVLTYVSTISIANQPIYIFKDKDEQEIRMNKSTLVPNYELLNVDLVQQ